MDRAYTSVDTPGGASFVLEDSVGLDRVDSIVFDCDGVLVDARNSYDRAVLETLDRMVGELFGVKVAWETRVPELVQVLRMTGRFNNDWNTTYALLLFAAGSLSAVHRELLERPGEGGLQPVVGPEASAVTDGMKTMADGLAASRNPPGVGSFASFLRGYVPDEAWPALRRVQSYAGFPGTPPASRLAALFDELYHGPELYKEMYGTAPSYYSGKGYIERDELIVRESDMRALWTLMAGRLALATGRPRLPTARALAGMMSYFHPEASVFIGDADRGPEYLKKLDAYRKPSGLSLIRAREEFDSQALLYVGDSAEDLQMVGNARSGGRILFAGVYGSAPDPEARKKFFMKNSADMVIPRVSSLPTLLRRGLR